MLTPLLIVYIVGIVVGLMRVDAAPATRIAVALLWPLGVIAGVVTVSALVLAAMVLFPILGTTALLAVLLLWWVAG